MPPKKVKRNPFLVALKAIWKAIEKFAIALWAILVQIGLVIKSILIVVEKALKIVAIFIIALSASVLFLFASLYLFSATFGLKEAPAFQVLRDRMAEVYSMSANQELDKLEAEIKEDRERHEASGGVIIVQ